LPVKEKAIKKKNRWFYYFIIETMTGAFYLAREIKKISGKIYMSLFCGKNNYSIYQEDAEVGDLVPKIWARQNTS